MGCISSGVSPSVLIISLSSANREMTYVSNTEVLFYFLDVLRRNQ